MSALMFICCGMNFAWCISACDDKEYFVAKVYFTVGVFNLALAVL